MLVEDAAIDLPRIWPKAGIFARSQEIFERREEKQTSSIFALLTCRERGREWLEKKKNECMMPIKKQESKKYHLHNTIKVAIVYLLIKMSLTSFQFGKYLKSLNLSSAFGFLREVKSRATGLKGRNSNKGLKQKWQWSPAKSLYKSSEW